MSYTEINPTAPGATTPVRYAPDRNRARNAQAAANRKGLLALATAVAMLGALMIVTTPRFAASQGVQLVKVDVAVVAKGYRASKLIGSSVINDKNEKIGSLDDIIIDQQESDVRGAAGRRLPWARQASCGGSLRQSANLRRWQEDSVARSHQG